MASKDAQNAQSDEMLNHESEQRLLLLIVSKVVLV